MLLLYSVVIIYSNLFCVNSFGFSTNRIISFANKDSITPSFPFWLPLIFFFFFMLDRISTSELNRSDNNRHPCLVPDARGKPSTLLPLSMMLSWRRQWHPTPVLLPGKSHGQRSLVGCSPWGH